MKTFTIAMLASLMSFAASAEMIEIQHELGTTKVMTNPKRVVTYGLGSLDAVEALGIKPVAISSSSVFPDYLAEYRNNNYISVGTTSEPNYEKLFMQKPDLIIIGPRSILVYDQLSKIAPTVLFAPDKKQDYWTSTKTQWRNLGKIFQKESFIEEKISKVDQEFKAIHAHNEKHQNNALVVMVAGGNLTAFSPTSRFSMIYDNFNFKPAVQSLKTSKHGDLISYEFIKKANPETLLVIDKDKLITKGKSDTKRAFENDLVKSTTAYQDKKLTYLDINAWYLSVPGLRATDSMINDIKSTVGI